MKYGIMTYHNIPNFGAILQAYALCKTIRKLGYDCEIIDYTCENIKRRELLFKKTDNVLKNILYRIFTWPHIEKKIRECRNYVELLYSKEKYNIDNISDSNDIYDGFISGSDMIWNLEVNGYDFNYFLNFVNENRKKISYGSSIGGKWDEEDLEKIKGLLLRYKFISAREEDTCNFIKEKLRLKCKHVMDPTMLITPYEWEKDLAEINEKNYVVVYFPSERLLEAAEKYCIENKKKLIVFQIVLPWKRKKSKIIYSPKEWLAYLKNADAVFTNSFHGLLFSIYFNKKVWTDNSSNRVESLLKNLHLDSCNLQIDPDCKSVIDYDMCNSEMEKLRNISLEYLELALRG